MSVVDSFEDFHPRRRSDWRKWLLKNHESSSGVWLVYYKKHVGKPRVAYDEAVEEALCFGWIDSLQRKIDDERAKLMFTPRRRGSIWSEPNKERVDRMIADGLMTDAGLSKVRAAKIDGSWNALDATNRLEMPKDLADELRTNGRAEKNFDSFSDSAKKAILYWLGSAKRPETRNARLEKIVRMAAINKRAVLDKE